MRQKIGDEHTTGRGQHTRCLAHGARRIIKKMQNLMDDDHASGPVFQRHISAIALAHLTMQAVGMVEARARNGQHIGVDVKTDRARCVRGE